MPEYRIECVQVTHTHGEVLVTAKNESEAKRKASEAIEKGHVDWGKREYVEDEYVGTVEVCE